jgi:hypothetical protein
MVRWFLLQLFVREEGSVVDSFVGRQYRRHPKASAQAVTNRFGWWLFRKGSEEFS